MRKEGGWGTGFGGPPCVLTGKWNLLNSVVKIPISIYSQVIEISMSTLI